MSRTYAISAAGGELPWLRDPVEAHRLWRATLSWKRDADTSDADAPLYTEHSNNLYRSFWGKFCRWLAARSLKLDAVRPAHIDAFLKTLEGRGGAPASVRTMRTYLAEIHRVFTHLAAIGVVEANPAETVLGRKRRAPETQFATDPPLPPGAAFLKAYEKTARTMFKEERAELPNAWTPARNLALRLVVAECGLKLSEICKLIPRNLTVQADGTVLIRSPGHRLVVTRPLVGRPVLAKALQGWLEVRAGLRIVQLRRARAEDGRRSNRLFLGQADRVMSAELVGGGLGDACSPVAPDLAERVITSCVKRTLESLGRQAAFHGPQLVRNAYAARLIHEGLSDIEVSEQLGTRTTFTARAIRAKLGLPDAAAPRAATSG